MEKTYRIRVKRIYEPVETEDGRRYLVDRLWPRGMKKEALNIDGWLKEVAPSPGLRKWFSHEAEKWEEFCQRYFAELDDNPSAWKLLLESARKGNITLLYSAREREHNNAVALKEYLEIQLQSEAR